MHDQDDAPKRPGRRSGDAAVLALAEGLLSTLGRTAPPSDLRTLRGVVETYPDDGRDGAGEVVTSLTGLIDDLLRSGQYDREALAVHVRAWRFMVSRRPDRKAKVAVMAGLRSVRDLYVPSQAA